MAVMLSVIMVLAMGSAVYADEVVTPPSDKVTGTVTVNNVEKDAQVLYYQIVDGTYNSNGLTGYEVVSGYSIADIEKPTSEEITAAAQTAITKTATGTMTWDAEKNEFTADVEAGSYLVLVKGTGDTLYNPMVVSVDYTDANDASTIDAGSVDAKTTFAYGNVAYAKSTTPTVDKKIVLADGTTAEGDTVNAKDGDGNAAGDTITFKIETKIPSYTTSTTTETSEEGGQTTTTNTTVYNPCIFKISDQLDDTFNTIENLTIKDGANNDLVENQDYELVAGGNGEKNFTVKLTEDYIKAHGNGEIVIEYNTTLSDTANAQNFDENKNTAKIEYSNDPTNGENTRTITDTTYHYTFGIDALANAEESEYGGEHERTETHELNKVTDEEGNTNYVKTDSVTFTDKTTKTQKSKKALGEAEFTLYSDDACTTELATATSDANGHISFTGLDEGTYYMKETNAPSGYTINDTVYKIVIDATLDSTSGIMTDYSITTYKKDGESWPQVGSAVYTCSEPSVDQETGEVTYTEVSTSVTPVSIVDTPNPELPSTGGAGVYLFTIIGVAVMAVMAYLFFKGEKSEA